MTKYPAMPLWCDAYVAGTTHLSDAEHGRYVLLLIAMWLAPMQRLPNDDVWLARKFNRSVEVIVSEWKPLLREFFRTDGNWWWHKRVRKEMAYLQKKSQAQSVRSKHRWQKEKTSSPDDAAPVSRRCNAPTPIPNLNKNSNTQSNPERVGARKTATKGTRWAADAEVPGDWQDAGTLARMKHGLPAVDTKLEAEKFANHFASATGTRACKVDWRKTWINWILAAEVPRGRSSPDSQQQRRPNARENFAIAAKRVLENIERQDGTAKGNPADADAPVGKLLPP